MSHEDGAVALISHPVAARLFQAGRRLRQWDTAHRWAWDTALVLVLFGLFSGADLSHQERPPDTPFDFSHLSVRQVLLLQAALVLPLWWRRRTPLPVLYATVAVFLLQFSAGIILRADAAVLVAVYSVVRHGRIRRLWWAIPPLLAVFVVAPVRLAPLASVWDVSFFIATAGTAAAALGFAVRVRGAQLAVLRDRAVRLEIERDQRSRLAIAAERSRVAREMHDIIGHSLSVIVTLADGGAYAAETAPHRSKEALGLIGDTGRRSLADLRRMLGVLREQTDEPSLQPQPGIADISLLCERIRAAGPAVEYRSTGDLSTLDPGVQLATYRIVQEALTNTLKHAGPHTTVQLALSVDGSKLRILVRDSGSPGAVTRPSHEGHGLIGMRERAALYGGTVTADPASDGGWQVRAELDLTPLPHSGGNPA
ncbi:sensor histidine kinase [Jidongwangia harbinensis]|uniref:sensor histidine kinase n=1 Tax=Jidongwangia harbinensis TaxID=2878561 RepID=UPI001CD936F5|nr:histidine kinase [Jidongwangia harbinensis]MCA2215536.1 histidine kinase [Jidongwangia harbinensis]